MQSTERGATPVGAAGSSGHNRSRRLRVAAVATAAAVLAVAATILVIRSADEGKPKDRFCDLLGQPGVPSTAPPLPDLEVFMSAKASGATIEAARRALAADRRVRRVRYVDQAETFRRFRFLYRGTPVVLRSVQAKNVPSSFELHLRRRSDAATLRRSLRSLRGLEAARLVTDLAQDRVLDLLVYPWSGLAAGKPLEIPAWHQFVVRRSKLWARRLDQLRGAAPDDLRDEVDEIVAGNIAVVFKGAAPAHTGPGFTGAQHFARVVRARCQLDLDDPVTTPPPETKAVRPTVPPD